MNSIWLKQYPKYIPHSIYVKNNSIPQEFRKCISPFLTQTAFENFKQKISFQEWDVLSDHWASFLTNHCKLKKGNRIAIQIPNLLQTPIAIIGALKAGLVVININPLYTNTELNQVLKDSKPHAFLTFNQFQYSLDIKIPYIIRTGVEDLFSTGKKILFYTLTRVTKKVAQFKINQSVILFQTALQIGRRHSFKPPKIQSDDVAFLQYTGGTTGISKGAMLTHKNILSNIAQAHCWMSSFLKKGKEVCITPLPLYHIFALTINLFVIPFYGSKSILISNPKKIRQLVRLIKNTKKWSLLIGVNALFKALLQDPLFQKIDFQYLKLTVSGGSSLESQIFKKWLKVTGNSICEGYGLTEASPVVCCNFFSKPQYGHCGYPFPSTHIRIVDEDQKELNIMQSGELQVKGPQVMKGYWNQPEETKNIFSKDGWLKTGDIAQILKDGSVQILDRKKDVIFVSGFNVYPSEVESVIASCKKVNQVAVIGVKDYLSNEVPKAFIVKNDQSLTKKEVIHFCKKQLTAYKIPKYVQFVDHLPYGHTGKVLKKSLHSITKHPSPHACN